MVVQPLASEILGQLQLSSRPPRLLKIVVHPNGVMHLDGVVHLFTPKRSASGIVAKACQLARNGEIKPLKNRVQDLPVDHFDRGGELCLGQLRRAETS